MIPFSKTQIQKNDYINLKISLSMGKIEGGGDFSSKAQVKMADLGFNKSLLTTSCTSALEMSAILLDLEPGDEIIMPSYTFVSTANAFLLRGCTPVFVDVCKNDLNIDPSLIESAITSRTKAITVVHYGGVSCDMNEILQLAKKYRLHVIEDAAQCIGAFFNNKPLGTLGTFGALSFHNTKNISSGEGGALLVNKKKFFKRANIIHEKGTNRHDFKLGKVCKYEWKDIGSSYILSDLSCAILHSQLSNLNKITKARLKIWNQYNAFCTNHDKYNNFFEIQKIPSYASHNGHLFYLLFKSRQLASKFNKAMHNYGVQTASHYVGLHSSSYGKINSRYQGDMKNTNKASNCLIRLPIWEGVDSSYIIEAMTKSLNKL
jgi:dTDP-4-amino-4,6-dideoxygalactose transaminase